MVRRQGHADGAGPAAGQGEAIIEFHAIGRSVKVSAVDPATLVEVSIVAPATASRSDMTGAVLKKLRYVLARRAQS
ncbi:MAG: DUF6898 family protein [Gemmatimonas sp.]